MVFVSIDRTVRFHAWRRTGHFSAPEAKLRFTVRFWLPCLLQPFVMLDCSQVYDFEMMRNHSKQMKTNLCGKSQLVVTVFSKVHFFTLHSDGFSIRCCFTVLVCTVTKAAKQFFFHKKNQLLKRWECTEVWTVYFFSLSVLGLYFALLPSWPRLHNWVLRFASFRNQQIQKHVNPVHQSNSRRNGCSNERNERNSHGRIHEAYLSKQLHNSGTGSRKGQFIDKQHSGKDWFIG